MFKVLWRVLTGDFRDEPTKIRVTVRNVGQGVLHLVEVRDVITGVTKRVEFELQPGYSKTIDLSLE